MRPYKMRLARAATFTDHGPRFTNHEQHYVCSIIRMPVDTSPTSKASLAGGFFWRRWIV